MARADFITQLKELGYRIDEKPNGMVILAYTVPLGKNKGKKLRLGFQVGNDFPMNCPPGPHFESKIVEGWIEPRTNIHNSPLGPNWRYWSRPFPDWNRTPKTAKVYLAHIKNLLNNIL